MTNGNGDLSRKIDDAISYPILTEEISYPGTPTTTPGAPGSAPLGRIVEGAIRDVLGWRPRANDSKGFSAALNQAFSLTQMEGHTEWRWIQRSYAAQADLGAITGAQASIHARARATLDELLPLLDGLYPLLPNADPEDTQATRSIVHSSLIELVNELGTEGGPRVQRIDSHFSLLLEYDPANPPDRLIDPTDPNLLPGQLGQLRERFGLKVQNVNTVEEEQNLTNFFLIVNYVDTLMLSWHQQRAFFDREGTDVFLGTQLVLLTRVLGVVSESVLEAYSAMQSVFLGPAERETTRLEFDDQPYLTVAELLEWVDRFASEEGPRLIQDAGKDGAVAFRHTLERLRDLMEEAAEISRSNSNNPTRGFHHPRVGNALEELASGLDEAFKLALQITRVLITSIDPDSGISGQWLTDVRVEGANFQEVMSIKLTKQGANPISGTNFAIVNPTRIRVDFNLTNAVVGQWSVVVTDRNQGEVVLKDVFTINSSSGNGIPVSPSLPPTLTSVEPPSADPDANVTLTLEGDNLDKVTEVLLVREGTPIKANNVEFVDATKQVVASFNLSAIRGNTTWTVVATNPDGEAKWESFTLEEPGLIERVWDEIGDLLRDLESGRQGARNLRVNISGKGLRDAKAVVFGQGITVRSMQFTRDQQLEVKINIAEDAVPGKRDITVIGPDGTPVILTDSFEVIER